MKKIIIESLQTVYDPEIPVNIYDLGLVYDIIINDNDVKIVMTMTSPTCPMVDEIVEMTRNAVINVPDVNSVEIEVVWNPSWDLSKMSEAARIELDLVGEGW